MNKIFLSEIHLFDFASDLDFIMNIISWIAILTVLAIIIYVGIGFFRKGWRLREENKGQATFLRGIGIFLIAVPISELFYILDYISRKVFGERIFGSAPYNFATVLDRDYFVLIFFVIFFSAAFLIYPLERYLLEMKRKILTTITTIAIPAPIILRIVEYSLDVNLTMSSPLYILFSVFWYGMWALIAVFVLILLILYIQVGKNAPKGSPAMKKSIAIIFALLIWLLAIFGTPTILKELYSFNTEFYRFILPFIIPTLLAVSLKLILYGYSSDEKE